ncbi:hypothetical protein H2200_002792 [Cladophialophora chaetospira]|uniref:Uncharacterized protein n=1 Tax=Cladophialophora chaetospira TaxID=386627 RepID=A0AA38XJI3_9EURO|nr:hypothetical protein H2200_002792 [Cladophialophora chaetospira]
MSVEEAVTEGLADPLDQNAKAAEETKKLLAELEADAGTTDKPEGTNGVKKEDATMEDVSNESGSAQNQGKDIKKEDHDDVEDEKRERRQDRGGRREYNDRGRGRGRGRGDRNSYNGRGQDRRERRDYDDRRPHRSYRDNVKFDASSLEITDDPNEIRKQVHFYFSDSNLPTDKHLFGLAGGVANNPVPLTELLKFKRMHRFQPFEAIVAALKDSKEVELANDDTAVRRIEPLSEDLFKAIPGKADPRTVYVKGFGEEDTTTQFDIEAFFDPYGPTRAVRLRRNGEKFFKGSVFVEFDTEELANAFLELDPKPKYKDKELQIMSKKAYTDKKEDDLLAGRTISNQDDRRGSKYGNRDRRESWDQGKRTRDRDDDRDWRDRRDEDQKRGFRDDKKRGGRGGGRGSRPEWRGGGRSKAPETDERGIPTIKSSAVEKDTGRSEALAKAKAAVEADLKKEQEAANDVESTEQNGVADASTETANAVADSVQADVEATAGKKRSREDDDDAEANREIKKVDTKTESEPATVES